MYTLLGQKFFFPPSKHSIGIPVMCQSCEEEITVWDITCRVMNGSIDFPVTRRSRVTGKTILPWMTRQVISHAVISDLTGLALLKIDENTKNTITIREKNDNNVMEKTCSHLTDFSKNLSNDYNSLWE